MLTAACARRDKPVVVAVGATVQEGLAEVAGDMGWMTNPEIITVGRVRMQAWGAEGTEKVSGGCLVSKVCAHMSVLHVSIHIQA